MSHNEYEKESNVLSDHELSEKEPISAEAESVKAEDELVPETPPNDDFHAVNEASNQVPIFTPDNNIKHYESITVSSPPKKKKRVFLRMVSSLLILVMVAGTFFGAGYVSAVYLDDSFLAQLFGTASKNVQINQIQPISYKDTTELEEAPVIVAREVSPAVVTVKSTYNRGNNNFFYNYNNEGSGSGSIFSITGEQLLVVTNFHVIQDSESVEIVTFNDHNYKATILGYDSLLDLAVLGINLADIPKEVLDTLAIVTFGDSNQLQVGEMAIAIGSPLGANFSNTLTVGVISDTDRFISLENSDHTLLQTDAAINPGNSGGALLNASGELIGINTAKYIDTDVEGLGFAIPINTAKPIIEKILNNPSGKDIAEAIPVDRPFLGVTIRDITESMSIETGIPFGVYVDDVFEGSGADEGGVLPGDVIISINNIRVLNTSELTSAIMFNEIGDEIALVVVRDEELINLKATLYNYADFAE